MSYFKTILSNRQLEDSPIPTPLWRLKVTDDEYCQLRQLLATEYSTSKSFEKYPKDAALYLAEWWKRNSGESNDSPFASLGFPKSADGDKLLLECAKRVYKPDDYCAYIPGIRLVKSDRGREFEYSLYYQGGFPMGRACTKKGIFWNNLIKKFVKKNLNFEGVQGAKIAKKALKEYKDYLVTAAREHKPDGMPFACDENHPWYKLAVASIQEGDKERSSRPFHIKWYIQRRVSDFVIKCHIVGPSRLDSNFLSQYPALMEADSIPVQLFKNDEYQDTLIEYQRTGRDSFFSYYDLDRSFFYDGESKISLRIPGIEQPIIVSDIDMSVPHSFYITSSGEFLMGAQKFGERTCVITYDEGWKIKEAIGPYKVLSSSFHGKNYSFLICCIPEDDSDISFIIKNTSCNEEYRFGSESTPTWTEVDLLQPYNSLVVETLYDFSNREQVCIKEMNDEEEDGIIAPPCNVFFRHTKNDNWTNAKLYGKVQCAVIHRDKKIFSTPEKDLISVGPNFEVKIIFSDHEGKETHYLINWDKGKIYSKDGKLQPNEKGIWVFKKEEYDGTVAFSCYPYEGTPFDVNIRVVYRDFGIYSPTGEKVKHLGIIPWSELSSFRYRAQGVDRLNISPYGETSYLKQIKQNADDLKGVPEEGSMSLLLDQERLNQYEWRADKGFDFRIRYTYFTLMQYPLRIEHDALNHLINLSIPVHSEYDSDEAIKESREALEESFRGHLLVIDENGTTIADIERNDDGSYSLPLIPNNSIIISNQRGYVMPMIYSEGSMSTLSSYIEDDGIFFNSTLEDQCWEAANAFLKIGLEHGIALQNLPKIGSVVKNAGLALALYCRNMILAGTDPEKISNVASSMNRLLNIGNIAFPDLKIDTFESVCKEDCFSKQFEEWKNIYGSDSREKFLLSIAGKVQNEIIKQQYEL